MRGRVLLGAHVTGPAAAWLLRRANLNADAIDAQRYFRSVGRADVADAIERALAELSAAEQAWRAAERNARPTSVNGRKLSNATMLPAGTITGSPGSLPV